MKKIIKYLVGIIAIALIYLLISNFNLIMFKNSNISTRNSWKDKWINRKKKMRKLSIQCYSSLSYME